MKWKNETKFHICGLNQEKLLNELCKTVPLTEIERKSKNDTSFKCSYFQHKKVEKFLKNKSIKLQSVTHEGLAFKLKKMLTCYGLIAAFVLFSVFYFVQDQFVLQYEIKGIDKLSSTEVVEYVKTTYPKNKNQIDVKSLEVGLLEKFDRISFVSCMIKGQTLVINIKEKLMPDEMYGDFKPMISKKDAKITQIKLISGTLKVKVGDIVRKGEVLVEPYTIDASGELKKVEAKAEILAEVYNEGSVDHYDSYVEVKRSGKVAVANDITLFGLSIYSFKEEHNFKMYEVEFEEVNLVKNLPLPFKMRKTLIYELQENKIETKFEDVKEEYVKKAKEKALEKCENYDTIKEEFYTLRCFPGVTIVNFCIVTAEQIASYA